MQEKNTINMRLLSKKRRRKLMISKGLESTMTRKIFKINRKSEIC